MEKTFTIRLATPADADGMLAVYAPYVEATAITFEYVVPPAKEFAGRIGNVIPEYPWLVCLYGEEIVGYSYAHKHRERTAYQWSPESTIYIAKEFHGFGIARVLYETLFAILKLQGFINVYAGVLSTNENSNKFHRALGFEEIGLFHNIGFKLGEWHSNKWYELHLSEHSPVPVTPVAFYHIADSMEVAGMLDEANKKLEAIHQTR